MVKHKETLTQSLNAKEYEESKLHQLWGLKGEHFWEKSLFIPSQTTIFTSGWKLWFWTIFLKPLLVIDFSRHNTGASDKQN